MAFGLRSYHLIQGRTCLVPKCSHKQRRPDLNVVFKHSQKDVAIRFHVRESVQ